MTIITVEVNSWHTVAMERERNFEEPSNKDTGKRQLWNKTKRKVKANLR